MSDRTVTGADLKTKTAAGGTVRLLVDHANVSYYIDQDFNCILRDWCEILDYLEEHGFEIMDDCDPEEHDWGYRWWVCHQDGEEFSD